MVIQPAGWRLGEFPYKCCSFPVFNIWFPHRIFYETFYSVFSNKLSTFLPRQRMIPPYKTKCDLWRKIEAMLKRKVPTIHLVRETRNRLGDLKGTVRSTWFLETKKASQTFQDSVDLRAARFLRHFLIWCYQRLLSPREMILEFRLRSCAERERHGFLSLPWMKRHTHCFSSSNVSLPGNNELLGFSFLNHWEMTTICLEHCYYLRVRKYQDHGWQV